MYRDEAIATSKFCYTVFQSAVGIICYLAFEFWYFKVLNSHNFRIMANFTHIIFDLDGTLTDNTQGIKNSLKYALEQMQIDGFSEDIMDKFIGPPLQWGFSNLFGMNERNTKLAVEYFREYYGENGWHQNDPYDGIVEMMAELGSASPGILESVAVKRGDSVKAGQVVAVLVSAPVSVVYLTVWGQVRF